MAVDIKFTKFDNTPWGFRLVGGSDFPQPLTVIRVTEGSLAECMGLQAGDVIVRLNDQPVSNLTHGKAHEALVLAGNNFVLGVLRNEESHKAVEAIQEENIVPYTVPLEELPSVFPEEEVTEEAIVETFIESETSVTLQTSRNVNDEEEIPEKPRDADSEEVPNQNLTDDEIAQLILEEEELLQDQGVLGVNFKKLRPRAPLLKDSKVFEELQSIATAEPPHVQELKRTTTFLQKPHRPVPLPKSQQESEPLKCESYKVVIKKQQKKSITERLLEKGLLEAGSIKGPKPRAEITPTLTPEPEEILNENASQGESMVEEKLNVILTEEDTAVEEEEEEERRGPEVEEFVEEESICGEDKAEEQQIEEVMPKIDTKIIKELVSTEISLEKQLENVQNQLLALKQLPSEIESHLKIVSEQLHKIMELSGAQDYSDSSSRRGSEQEREEVEETNVNREERKEDDKEEGGEEEEEEPETKESAETRDETLGSEVRNGVAIVDNEVPEIIEPDEDEPQEKKELEIKVKSDDETGKKVKKFIVSYESKVLKSREPSPAPSNGSFEPDPNLAPKDQVIQELQHKRGRKHSQDLWPQPKQLELTYGRRWRCPNDFFNDEMIAEVLSSQAEVIHGRALGINFKKYEKTNLPNYDHLMNSSVYKMVHKMEREPTKGIPVRPAKVNAAEDILERAKSPAGLSDADDRSNRSVGH